jgi:chromate transporter
MKAYIELFLTFVKLGVITFGGGYAMLPVIERELINKKKWITNDEVLDYFTIAQVTPGIIAVNVSTFVGHKRKGALGGALATIGFIFLPVCFVITIGICLKNFAHYEVVQHAFSGIRIAVAALILDTIIKMCRSAFKGIISVAICVAAFLMTIIFSANPVVLVLAFGCVGFLLYRPRAKKTTGL